jgi:glycosyltransferase involved in cell wall biosynthesis
MPPTVSIIIPAHNAKAWVKETVGSVLAQTYTDYELVVVDDGSTDGTLDVVAQALHGSSARHTLHRLPRNAGASAARNFGLDNSTGRYILWLDADDLLTPTALHDHVALLDAEPSVGVSFAAWDIFWGDSEMAKAKHLTLPDTQRLLAVLSSGNGGWWVPPGGMMLRREACEAVDTAFGGWSSKLPVMEDVHYYACLLHLGMEFRCTEQLGVRYRYSPYSTSHSASRLVQLYSQLQLLEFWTAKTGLLELQQRKARHFALLQEHVQLQILIHPVATLAQGGGST